MDTHRGPVMVPTPCQAPPMVHLDPDLLLTPERPIEKMMLKKSVKFLSPAKSKARRQVVLEGKENNMSEIGLDSPVSSDSRKPLKKKERSSKTSSSRLSKAVQDSKSSAVENHLDRPELHSTLHLGRDILQLQSQDIDLVHAVKHRLVVSEQDRKNVKQKTYSKLNSAVQAPDQYNRIVSVEVPTARLVKGAEKQLRKTVKFVPTRPLNENSEKPSLMKYFNPERAFRSCTSTDQHGYQPSCLSQKLPRTYQGSFDIHKRMTMWDT